MSSSLSQEMISERTMILVSVTRFMVSSVKLPNQAPFVSLHCKIYIYQVPLFSIFHGHFCCKLKTVFTDYHTVCSKACLLMSEPMKRDAGGEGDEVRAASHAPRP